MIHKKNIIIKNHCFKNIDAMEFGIPEAILLNFITEIIEKKCENNTDTIDGKVWIYIKTSEILHEFPYFKNQQKIIRTLASLVHKGALIKEDYNICKNDFTLWYALADKINSVKS